ncbi:putative nicotinate-nucleotide pyrophosphorylase [carboxylating] [Geobacillus stearothermophilus]|uniref:carboxylating nicotinate-nucleotide diphosphorylase n=1 Tax=unclassified Geobacillus TaxID=2642459 RepID=UPI0005CCBA5B|nr:MULTISPECIES: carboxylating nicotinate-nucleotide diphosphorylase [unclassified Geobacillus]AKM19901.1 putative nicotinate-nucleotide pyrophosphorylase (carboxylating) [Geobacillus sp. 12AMOR1]AKU25903.1 nicotinate-nucleotide pyrophosphorylase [Geobacillus sp. LC300]KZE94985.1 putative nicotinate-nucleotide pyrophosphorylase [carboxylating] [Geobacillus stearothermophilus]NNU98762.1 carboxylating nicotinate-nucleotide diphosphorylase [Geobacillus sp. DSP4a]PJW15760.1 nicotinate-nucleotide d
MNRLKLEQLLRQFFLEDIGDGDVTSETIFPAHERASGMFMAKADGVVAGVGIIAAGYQLLDPRVEVTIMKRDGERVAAGEAIAAASGPVRALLSGERVILNLLQRLSGIATVTRQAVDLLGDSHTRICDTRKTTPGLRMLEKYAVTCGGGYNHRFGLYDGVMIKDNHIAFCGSIADAVKAVRERLGHMVKIEVETETEAEVLEAVEAGADVIMFDNRTPDEVRSFVRLVPKPIITEASGGITLANVAAYGATGVDYISLGFLTHSARALDISFDLQ